MYKAKNEHLQTCPATLVACKFSNCFVNMKRGDIGSHEKQCPMQLPSCDKCKHIEEGLAAKEKKIGELEEKLITSQNKMKALF